MRILLTLILLAGSALSQTSSGTMVGVVTDPSGAAVAATKITLRHLTTGETREAAANERGEFSVPILRIGDYALTAGANGPTTQSAMATTITVDQTLIRP